MREPILLLPVTLLLVLAAPGNAAEPGGAPVEVRGMDATHAAAARERFTAFSAVIDRYHARDLCRELDATKAQAAVAYDASSQSTTAVVLLHGVPALGVGRWPGGRSLPISCASVAAFAACSAWGTSTAWVEQELEGGSLRFAFTCGASGPTASGLVLRDRTGDHAVPIYKPSFHFIALEFPRTLPDGSPNGTQRLISALGERDASP